MFTLLSFAKTSNSSRFIGSLTLVREQPHFALLLIKLAIPKPSFPQTTHHQIPTSRSPTLQSLPATNRQVHCAINDMYNVNITGSFAGVFPSSLSVDSKKHSAAVRHYKKALRATVVKQGSQVVLESAYGFRFKVNASRGSSGTSVRLSLPNSGHRGSVARALGAGGRVSHHRSGLVVHDPFGVTWTLA